MTPSGGKRTGAGRPPRPNSKRHGVILDDEIYAFLEEHGAYTNEKGKRIKNASRGIELLYREHMADEQMAREQGQSEEGRE